MEVNEIKELVYNTYMATEQGREKVAASCIHPGRTLLASGSVLLKTERDDGCVYNFKEVIARYERILNSTPEVEKTKNVFRTLRCLLGDLKGLQDAVQSRATKTKQRVTSR